MNTPGLLSFLALALAAAPAFAQSMQVLSSGQEARRCSDAAQMASTIGGASRTDLEDCNRALVTVALRQRDRAATLVNRGILESALGDQDAAMASYDKALVVMPELPEPWVGRGNVLFLRGDAAGAITAYERSLAMGITRRHVVLLNRGMAWEARGELARAEQDYRDALLIAPEWALATSRLERVLAKRKAAATPEPVAAPKP
jgi:tetratricopeptide (TPR) repeat protein